MEGIRQSVHLSVLHSDVGDSPVLKLLQPKPGETVLDVTLGLGGHAAAFLKETAPNGLLIGLDADAENLSSASKRLSPWAQRIRLHHCNFGDISSLLPMSADIVFADLGVSSPHFDDASRGFTFRTTAPLDMRYDRSRGKTAAEFLSECREEEIVRVLREYGEIHQSMRLAHALKVRFQEGEPMDPSRRTTDDVRKTVEEVYGYRAPRVLPQVFQALRIRVNDELGALERLLAALPSLLRVGARAGIISYHSLEDRMVKQAFRAWTTPRKNPQTGAIAVEAPFVLLTKKPTMPSQDEQLRNPRSRSARMRAVRYVHAGNI